MEIKQKYIIFAVHFMKNENENQELDFSAFSLDNLLDPTFESEVETPASTEEPEEEESTEEVEKTPEEQEDDIVKAPVAKQEDVEVDEESLVPFYEALNKELGIEDFNPDEIGEGIPGLMDYLKNIVTNTVEAEVEDLRSMGDGLMGNLYDFLKNGGKVEDFKKVYFDQPNFKEIDIEDNEANQKLVLDEYLKEQGFDDEERQEKIESYVETGLLERESRTAKKKLAVIQERRESDIVKQQIQANAEREQQVKDYWNDISKTIETSDKLGTLPIPKAKRNEFKEFLMTKGKDGMTPYQRKIQNKEEALKLALVSFLDYDFTAIKKEVKSEVTKDLKKTISRFTDTNAKSKTSVEVDLDTSKKTDFSAFRLPIHQ